MGRRTHTSIVPCSSGRGCGEVFIYEYDTMRERHKYDRERQPLLCSLCSLTGWAAVFLASLPRDERRWGVKASNAFASNLCTLGRNLAVAGALQKMFDLGWERGHACGDVSVSADEWLRAKREAWRPNTDGKAAP